MNVTHLRDRIEALPKIHHKEVARILLDNNITFDENKNGMFINLSTVTQEVLEKIARFVSYVDLQQQTIDHGETERKDIKVQYFNDTLN
jgi:hypothetical protein